MKRFFGMIFLVFLIQWGFAQTGGRADFFVAEKPENLRIYNKYEQQLDFKGLREFFAFLPMRITAEDAFLSDDFTPCMTVIVGTENYYILQNEDRTPINIENAGQYEFYRNCDVLPTDVLEVLVDNTLFLVKEKTFRETAASQKYFLTSGTRLKRLFKQKNYQFVEKLDAPKDFGWVYINPQKENVSWGFYNAAQAENAELTAQQQNQITQAFLAVNQKLAQLFAHFNQEANSSQTAPEWQKSSNDGVVIYTLVPQTLAPNFQESTTYLVRKLENILLGSAYQVVYADGIIQILQKD